MSYPGENMTPGTYIRSLTPTSLDAPGIHSEDVPIGNLNISRLEEWTVENDSDESLLLRSLADSAVSLLTAQRDVSELSAAQAATIETIEDLATKENALGEALRCAFESPSSLHI